MICKYKEEQWKKKQSIEYFADEIFILYNNKY